MESPNPQCEVKKEEIATLIEGMNQASYDKYIVEREYTTNENNLQKLQEKLEFYMFKFSNVTDDAQDQKQEIAITIQKLQNSITKAEEKYNNNVTALTNIDTFLQQSSEKVKQLLAEVEKCRL